MRRRVVPALIALLAAALAVWRRRAMHAGEHGHMLAEEPVAALPEPARQLEAAPHTPSDAPGADPEPPAAAPPAAAPEPPTAEPEPEAEGDEPTAAPAPTNGPRFVSIPWTLAEAGGKDEAALHDQLELAIRFTLLGGRMELDRIDVRETDSQVFVTVLARYEPPPPGRPTPHYGVARDATVRLGRPLGDRALVHAPDQFDELTGSA